MRNFWLFLISWVYSYLIILILILNDCTLVRGWKCSIKFFINVALVILFLILFLLLDCFLWDEPLDFLWDYIYMIMVCVFEGSGTSALTIVVITEDQSLARLKHVRKVLFFVFDFSPRITIEDERKFFNLIIILEVSVLLEINTLLTFIFDIPTLIHKTTFCIAVYCWNHFFKSLNLF